jgi:hypothetical protein
MYVTWTDADGRTINMGDRVIDVNTGEAGGTVTRLIEPEDHGARVEVTYDDGSEETWICSQIGWDSGDWRCDDIEIAP